MLNSVFQNILYNTFSQNILGAWSESYGKAYHVKGNG